MWVSRGFFFWRERVAAVLLSILYWLVRSCIFISRLLHLAKKACVTFLNVHPAAFASAFLTCNNITNNGNLYCQSALVVKTGGLPLKHPSAFVLALLRATPLIDCLHMISPVKNVHATPLRADPTTRDVSKRRVLSILEAYVSQIACTNPSSSSFMDYLLKSL